MSVMVGPSLPPCRDEGVPVHHDPVHGIVANPGNENGGGPHCHFLSLRQSRAQGLGELVPPHFPGYRPTWSLSKRKRLYTVHNVTRVSLNTVLVRFFDERRDDTVCVY